MTRYATKVVTRPEKEQTGANASFEFGRRNVVTRYYTTLVTRKNSKQGLIQDLNLGGAI